MTFAQRLRELRDKAGLSEAKLAAESGLSFALVHGYGLGRRAPSFAAAIRLARALGVSIEAFADCDDLQDGPRPRGTGRPPAKEKGKKTR